MRQHPNSIKFNKTNEIIQVICNHLNKNHESLEFLIENYDSILVLSSCVLFLSISKMIIRKYHKAIVAFFVNLVNKIKNKQNAQVDEMAANEVNETNAGLFELLYFIT